LDLLGNQTGFRTSLSKNLGEIMKRIWFLIVMIAIGWGYANAQDRPVWVDNPSAVYPERLYVSAVGSGRDRRGAETGALGSLSSYFKQSVTSTINIRDTERQVNGQSSSESQMSQSIEAASALDALIGAEIKTAWNDAKNNTWYAAAVMEKAVCGGLYASEIDKAMTEIRALIGIPGDPSFEAIGNCQKARGILEKAEIYTLVLRMLGGPNRQVEVSQLSIAITAALAEARAVPVDVRVNGDVNGRIKAAFAEVFTAAGFRTGNQNSRFVLEVVMNMTPVTGGRYFNTRYTVDAVLKDTRNGTELFSYNTGNRESHPAGQGEADNRAVIGAERKIANDFPEILQGYINDNG
jgi:hypothetical protein